MYLSSILSFNIVSYINCYPSVLVTDIVGILDPEAHGGKEGQLLFIYVKRAQNIFAMYSYSLWGSMFKEACYYSKLCLFPVITFRSLILINEEQKS